MRSIQTDVLVIGGGATGTGIVRDLAMRGFDAVLVEKGDLAYGTTGRYHGLLHSGGRYVVKDPHAARECIEENQILRRIMPGCIEDTGGFFVLTPWDDPGYADHFLDGCKQAAIPVEEISIPHMLQEEPLLNPGMLRCFRVPDASADSFLAADLNAASARQYGAHILSYHKIIGINVEKQKVTGALCQDLVNDEKVSIHADIVVNASGAWAGQIAALCGIKVNIIPGKGTMLAMNHRIVNTVINRCKIPSDGDILVPAHTVAVIGTTDVKVEDPDQFGIEPWEVHLMLVEGEKLVPGFKDMRILRAWAGVRPLYQEKAVNDTRDVTRAYILLDHSDRDGIEQFITITSGKWTTYRKMAEMTVDLVCRKLNTHRPCRTHLEPLSNSSEHQAHFLGARLERIEKNLSYGNLVCECELATYEDVVNAITKGQAKTIDDVRRDIRLGMGPCQGGFCTVRVAGILHKLRQLPVESINVALRDFLQERWKGLLPILWGQQLRQERLDELIYLSLLNTDHLPGPLSSRLSPLSYSIPSPAPKITQNDQDQHIQDRVFIQPSEAQSRSTLLDVLVIGAGLSGLASAWQAAARGKRTQLISKGHGALYWHAGCIDVLGYYPNDNRLLVQSPLESLANLIKFEPRHPYAQAGLEKLQETLSAFQELCAEAGYPMQGSLEQNWLLPSALGTLRPTCLAPETMIAGDLRQPGDILVVGFQGFHDFYPAWTAANLNAIGSLTSQSPARGITLELPVLSARNFLTSRVLAGLFEQPGFRQEMAATLLKSLAKSSDPLPQRIGFPAVLGFEHPLEILHDLQNLIGLPVFEIPCLPPSVPGIRLNQILVSAIQRLGGRVDYGMQAISAQSASVQISEVPQSAVSPSTTGHSLSAVLTEAAARMRPHYARSFILATGGLLGGGVSAEYTGESSGQLKEVIYDLPIQAPEDRQAWLNREFLSSTPHPVFQAGVQVNQHFQPITKGGQLIYDNLYVAGTILAGADYLHQRSFDGVALVTGYLAGSLI